MTSRGIIYFLELRNVRKLSMLHLFLVKIVNSFYDRTRRLCQKQTTHSHLLHRKFNRHRKARKVTLMNLGVTKKEIYQKYI